MEGFFYGRRKGVGVKERGRLGVKWEAWEGRKEKWRGRGKGRGV